MERGDPESQRRALAASGFSDGHLYHSARPDYPEQAIAYLVTELGLDPHSHLVDLGAGTGILTAQLLGHCGQLTAVEPSAEMRGVLAANLPQVKVVEGRDTDTGLPSGLADAVVVGQAFHWFDAAAALAEIHRVLVRGGRLGLVWNERDESVDWVQALTVAMAWDRQRPYGLNSDYRPIIEAGPFRDVARAVFSHRQILDHEGLRQRVQSTSYITVMEPAQRKAVLDAVDEVIAELPEPVELPYLTVAYRATAED